MSITDDENSFVVSGGAIISMAQMFAITASSSDPTYLIVSGLDRDEYTATATGATGTVSGNGYSDDFTSDGGDARAVGIVFTYNAATGGYYNAKYGYLNQLTYTASSSLNDITSLSLYGTSSLSIANSLTISDPYSLMQSLLTYYGSVTVATQPSFKSPVPAQATPDSVAAVAATFVGDVWNLGGCWVLTSTIAAESGASLPAQSTLVGIPGVANGEWQVAFNGPAGQTGDWESMVTTGDMILIYNPTTNLAHITTCVAGSGATAMVIDNAEFAEQGGQSINAANDGDVNDLIIQPAHLAAAEWAGVASEYVVIYQLDCPAVTETMASDTIRGGASLSLGDIFSAIDPFGTAITQYQIYDSATGDTLRVGGAAVSAHTEATADTVSSLSRISLVGGTTCADTVAVRAENTNGYWGDWQTLAVTVLTSPPTISGTVADQTVASPGTIAPFSGVVIGDANIAQTETVTVTLSAPANGTLSNLGGGSYDPSTGLYTDSGSAPAVTAALEGVVFTPAVAASSSVITDFTVSDIDSAGASATDSTTSVFATDSTPVVVAPAVPTPTQFAMTDTTTGLSSTIVGTPYSGPVGGLQSEFITTTADSLAITATAPNVFIHAGSGNNAINVSSANGNNVLDGGDGSNFLVGGTGDDTFFVDDRSPAAPIWDTVVNFHPGDAATVWGVTPNDFTLSWVNGQGANGYTGLTLHVTAPGVPTACLTLTGFTTADLTNGKLSVSFGTTAAVDGLPSSTYMYVHGA